MPVYLNPQSSYFDKSFDTTSPDFQLLMKRFNQDAPAPKFKGNRESKLDKYRKGLTIFQSDQCPYLGKCIPEICQTAQKVYGIEPEIVELRSCRDVEDNPCAFGVFGMVYNGKIIAEHMISSKRFANIMDKELKV